MKTMLLAVLIFLLLLTLTPFVNVPEVSATTTEDLWTTPALPEDVPRDPMPENFTTEDYLNTTNPYSQINPLGEGNDEEGSHPLYVLVFGDEEERKHKVSEDERLLSKSSVCLLCLSRHETGN